MIASSKQNVYQRQYLANWANQWRTSDRLFLITPEKEYRYRDLVEFAEGLSNEHQDSPVISLVLSPESSPRDLLTIAAHFILGNPIHLVPPVSTDEGRGNSSLSVTNYVIEQLHSREKENDIAVYCYTSGTSSSSKCVPVRRSQIEAASMGAKHNFAPDSDKAWLLNLPLMHVGGLSILFRSLMWETAVYLPNSRDLDQVGKLLETEKRIQTVSLVYTQWKRLIDAGVEPHNEMKAILLGGGPVPESYLQHLRSNLTPLPPLFNSYGMTETFAMISYRDLRDSNVMGNVGYPLKDQQIRISKEGEIEVKGSQVFHGYIPLQDHPAPPHPFTDDGWFRTGDFGKFEPDGSLNILSRRTDLIVSGGKNIVPNEVEQVLTDLSYVQEVAVTSMPDEEWGEIVVALIVLKPDLEHDLQTGFETGTFKNYLSQTERNLIQMIRQDASFRLEGHQLPKRVLLVNELPRTALGKIKRSDLRELAVRKS